MTLEDAEKLCKVFVTVDGQCPSCISAVCEEAGEAFPEFEWKLDESKAEYEVTVNQK